MSASQHKVGEFYLQGSREGDNLVALCIELENGNAAGRSYQILGENITPEQGAFIVRAVNSHEALVEALHNLLANARPYSSDDGIWPLIISQAEAALKLAKG